MFIAWALFPLVMLAVCLGCGLLVEWASGWRLPGAMVPSAGFALVIAAATLFTYTRATAHLATPAIVVLAVAGYATLARTRRRLVPDPYAVAVAAGVFAVLAAPIVLSGNATFLGYFVLNDGAFHFALIDQLLSHGHDLAGIPPSSYSAALHSYLGSGYPLGSQVAAGALRALVGQNIAWVFQPFIAMALVFGALALYALLDGVVRSRMLRAACAFVAAQSGLLYGYYLEASIKELVTTWAITATVVMVLTTLRERVTVRRAIPLALVAVAALAVLNLAIVPWVCVPLVCFAVVAAWRSRVVVRQMSKRRLGLAAVGALAALGAIAAPMIATARTFFSVSTSVLTRQGDLGNLITPLRKWQLLGIWPSGDFRLPVATNAEPAFVLIGLAIAGAVLGAAWIVRRRSAGPLLLLANGVAAAYLLSRASPYAAGKVMAIFSVTVVLLAMLGAAALHDSGHRIEGWALAGAIAGGVLWTNAVAYRGASIAPRARMQELASIGARFSGDEPAFYNLSDEYAMHFLAREAPDSPILGAPSPRPGLPARSASLLRAPWDTDELDEQFLQGFRLLVLGRSPLYSRPPADYRLAERTRYYDVWRRTSSPRVLEHVALGGALSPVAAPRCASVLAVASRAQREHARLAFSVRAKPDVFVPTRAQRPPNWGLVFGDPYSLIPRKEDGSASGAIDTPRAGRFEVWLEGSFSRKIAVRIDGRIVGSASYQMGPPDQSVSVGTVTLGAGKHDIAIVVGSDHLVPGAMAFGQTIGPVVLAPAAEEEAVAQVAPSAARSLCGRSLDWIEIVR